MIPEEIDAQLPLPPDCTALLPLLADYAAKDLPPAEAARVAAHLPHCPDCQARLAEYQMLLPLLADVAPELPPLALRDDFLAMLAAEKHTLQAARISARPAAAVVRPLWSAGALDAATAGWLRIAASVALLVVGATLGWLLARPGSPSEATLAYSQAESAQLLARQLTATNGQPSMASSRIQLVHEAVAENVRPGDPTVLVLINTLNADPNPNVRLAAAEALFRLRADSLVGPALAQSLAVQTDPNVQITLIDMLVSLRRKQAVPQLQRLAQRPDALPVVRHQATQGIGVLL
ncbi:HEAT repeat domain-containing protein [Hymenobacter terrestris]|uniref:HEAT repeat domain-containing protein n=1 Tax=Hymenobacter terrestris TaxID=2748310 RepID=A0ABX2Q7S6_9BACT|nr:HEAT repeat domain-containing protein [Hymenobacter terrestris]NVO86634.1 HEAT repeat domain-containing protein [Hymenobacter terrestris]